MKTLLRGVLGLGVAALSLAACADSDRYPAALKVETGAFVDSAVSQLRYETATQSGWTTDAGEFNYVAGERISFFLGGIELGSTGAKAQLTPFDLVGATPATSEAELRAAFNNSGYASPLERAANMSLFFQVLDADRDETNGIDLTGLDTVLADATLNFDVDTSSFMLSNLRPLLLTYDIGDASVPVTDSLSHLYETLGLSVAINMLATQNADTNGDGTVDSFTRNTYDSEGHTTLIELGDSTGVTYRTTTGYSGDRIISRLYESSPLGDGTFNTQNSNTYAYNSAGLITNQTTEVTTAGTLTRRTLRTYTYDNDSNQTLFRTENDSNGDGTIDATTDDAFTYDAMGRSTGRVTTYYDATGTATRVSTTVTTRDAAGNIIHETYDDDTTPSDGIVGSGTVDTQTFDASNHVLTLVRESIAVGGDVAGRTSTTYAYNSDGQLVTQLVEVIDTTTDTTSSTTLTTNTYVDNRLAHVETEADGNADGTAETVTSRTITRDAYGTVASDITDTYDNTDGTLTAVSTTTNSFDANGNNQLLTITSYNVTAGTEVKSIYTNTYVEVTNGVRAALYYYAVLGQL